MVINRRLPPIRPPRRPMAAMTRDMSELVTLGARIGVSSELVKRRTIWKAAWFTSLECAVLLKRFGIDSVCHEMKGLCA